MTNDADGAALDEGLPFRVMRRTWQPVLLSSDVMEGHSRSCHLLDVDLLVVRMGGVLMVAQAHCPHKGSKLEMGTVGRDRLRCAYHGWEFGTDGGCVAIPSMAEADAAKLAQAGLQTYASQERYGMIWVRLEAEEWAPLPAVPEFEDPGWTFVVAEPTPFRAGYRREIENYLDMTHFAFAHGETLGIAADPVVPPQSIQEFDDGFEMRAPFPSLASPGTQPGKLQQSHQRRQRCWLPNFTTIRQSFPDGDERVLLHVPSPSTHDTCTVFWALAISRDFRGPPPAEQLAFAVSVLEEDRLMCENQVPREVPINPTRGGWGVLVAPGDTLANTYQRTFRRFLLRHLEAARP